MSLSCARAIGALGDAGGAALAVVAVGLAVAAADRTILACAHRARLNADAAKVRRGAAARAGIAPLTARACHAGNAATDLAVSRGCRLRGGDSEAGNCGAEQSRGHEPSVLSPSVPLRRVSDDAAVRSDRMYFDRLACPARLHSRLGTEPLDAVATAHRGKTRRPRERNVACLSSRTRRRRQINATTRRGGDVRIRTRVGGQGPKHPQQRNGKDAHFHTLPHKLTMRQEFGR